GDLVVALEAGDDEQLLVDLRALRQCKEAARLQPARDEEVTRAFRCRLRHDRRLDVDEAVGLHLLADDRDEPRTQADVPLHLLPPQVEPPVAEAKRLVDAFLVELERPRRRTRDDAQLCRLQLHLAVLDAQVPRLGRALAALAGGLHDELFAQLMRDASRPGGVRRVDHDLQHAALVAEVEEDEPAEVAPPRHPARDRDLAALVADAERTRLDVTPLRHERNSRKRPSSSIGRSCCPADRSVAVPSAEMTTTRCATFCPRVSWPRSERPAKSVSAEKPSRRTAASHDVAEAPSSAAKKT